MTRFSWQDDLPAGHAIARIVLACLVVLLLAGAVTLAIIQWSDEMAFARTVSDTFRNWLV